MASSTTEILFNSPALHALKRAQLVQLCKRHGIKASGKNMELVSRLRQHALALPTDNPLNVAIRSEPALASTDNLALMNDDDDTDGDDERRKLPRPSEQWEIVMDDIPEADEQSQPMGTMTSCTSTNTLAVPGEFGTGGSGSSKSTMTSSIKAFATSLGLKRSVTAITATSETSTIKSMASSRTALSSVSNRVLGIAPNTRSRGKDRDSLTAHAVPYSSIPQSKVPPHVEPFAFSFNGAADTSLSHDSIDTVGGCTSMDNSIDRPVPGLAGREGVDASCVFPSTGDQSAAIGGTIRLVTPAAVNDYMSPPRLQPFAPSFDLVPPTPGPNLTSQLTLWPPQSPNVGVAAQETGIMSRLYPSLEAEKAELAKAKGDVEMEVDVPGGISPPRTPAKDRPQSSLLSPPRKEPFVFGSPNPRHSASKADFANAAAGVLAEMNARLGAAGVKAIDNSLLKSLDPANRKASQESLMSHQFGGKRDKDSAGASKEGSLGWKFDRAHDKVFSKMDSINTHYAARRPLANAALEEKEEENEVEEKEETVAPLPTNRKRKSAALGPVPGPVGKRRPSVILSGPAAAKKRRSSARVISAGTRRKMNLPGAFGDDDDDDGDDELAGVEAVQGSAPKRVSIAPPQKDKAAEEDEEEGLKRKQREAVKRKLEINKARRRSSRGRPSVGGPRLSAAQQKQKAATSRFGFGFVSSAAKSIVKSVWGRAPTASSAIPIAKPPAKASVAAKPPPAPSAPVPLGPKLKETRPPIPEAKKPSFEGGKRVPSSASGDGLLKPVGPSRVASTTSTTSAASSTGRPRSRSPIPSFGVPGSSMRSTRSSTSAGSKIGGTAGSRMSTATGIAGSMGSMGVNSRLAPTGSVRRPSSTLLAPTASSLAKMHPTVRPSISGSRNISGSSSSNIPMLASNASLSRAREGPIASALSPQQSKIPVVAPLSPRKKTLSPGAAGSIFSTPLILPSSPAAQAAAAAGEEVNPITGIRSPVRAPLGSAAVNTIGPVGRVPSIQRKPRISRSKVIAKLGAQRAATSGLTGQNSGSAASSLASKRGRARSSIGARSRKSGTGAGVKAATGLAGSRVSGAGAAAMMSAKKRARQSEYFRRKSARASVAPSNAPLSGRDELEMEVDE